MEELIWRKCPIYVLMAKPGAGKGEQRKALERVFETREESYLSIETGSLLREVARDKNNPLCETVQDYMQRGELVPDSIVNELVENKLKNLPKDRKTNIIFDGFPRNRNQAEKFVEIISRLGFKNITIIELEILDELAISRMMHRSVIEGRSDDNPNTIRGRIDTFYRETEPVIRYVEEICKKKVKVDASGSIKEVTVEMLNKTSLVPAKMVS